jgi:RNA 2',3'-cyclic 3'-phosphodiesterase
MRLFIATSFPAEVLHDLNERVARLRPRLPAASWVREESQHATFAFLGEHSEALIERIEPALTSNLAAIPRFEAHLEGSGFFPNARHARVGWIGLTPHSSFIRVAEAVRSVVTKNGVELDGGEFRPHLTLMRMRDPWPPASIELFGKTLGDFRSPSFSLDAVTLYSSELHPKGAIHTPLKQFPLS